jgi:energy-converting hydrogenase Eha subunit A
MMVSSRETFNVKIIMSVVEDLHHLVLLVVFAKLLLISQIALKYPIQNQSAKTTSWAKLQIVLPSTQIAPGVFAIMENASNYC